MFNLEDYDYDLPGEYIAQTPLERRDDSRLMKVDRARRFFSNHRFRDLPRLLKSGDLLVVNNTRVVPARLFGRKESGGRIEILVLDHAPPGRSGNDIRWCLLRSSKRPRRGSRLFFDGEITGHVKDLGEDGLVRIAFEGPVPLDTILEEKGTMPLPPYIRRSADDGMEAVDRERYQTVFSKEKGAVAAPTAGLHFTGTVLKSLREAGIEVVELTLHVGHGTFRPVRTKDIRKHHLGKESYRVGKETAEAVNRCKAEGRRVIAVGTTVVRTLETLADSEGYITHGNGTTDLLITPGYRFKAVDGLITNFHLPKSSLLFLVSAFAGRELIKEAYQWAMEKRYRFYSYGDAMVIL
ncbi:MAG: tRNA preQ1(34) S-adenosylmethionine ribosyltransferase-isomerase QueA [Deltaproteobacteria bacterium]|nr:tRNA preQ1(34) S-adenosylmethionine ribosyltransferase-isomerase QueA [Deltaproteobacteria bacterium]MBW2015855.1 tRNA preQ1(34) S-adenosylmethionine ribosyltransferase-isomerase QueA [Deltaproteobacteria bacterium]MBW2128986.1 tRNA preQ1(34) S-adenosylmethionine ribosyltransferase-isomerase QueA [Deltaproteobacteria bacterium]MBW2302919.1 tRNA preQ1(34) S-adenosylmethionine ribosyltransferase-isomerase QueA [Deltaproteobacteria bacterium]